MSRLLISGDAKAVIDLSGLGFDADSAARVGLAAVLRAWRYDRYRTKLKDKQKPTLEEVIVVGGDPGAGQRYKERWAPVAEGVGRDRVDRAGARADASISVERKSVNSASRKSRQSTIRTCVCSPSLSPKAARSYRAG